MIQSLRSSRVSLSSLFSTTALAVLMSSSSVLAQTAQDKAVLVSAQVQTAPPQVTLTWPTTRYPSGYVVYRKLPSEGVWQTQGSLASNATSYVDSNVSLASSYEYWVRKNSTNYSYVGDGYIAASIEGPLVENRGKVVLIVESTKASTLTNELTRLQQDLVGDGWTVLRHDIASNQPVATVKALIKNDYLQDTNNVKSVFLFGHVPVPYSGNMAPDGHGNHVGAWPADVYYGDMTGTWTDTSVNSTNASSTRNRNVPGDGKFDQTSLPAPVTLQVGRVDLFNMPAFTLSESGLLRQYLNKDHDYRHKGFVAQPRGVIDDNFGWFYGEAFASSGWRAFSAFFGPSNVFAAKYFATLATNSYLWAYGCGGGSYTSASGVGVTAQFQTNATLGVFNMLFGSYFGDWDNQNNFLRGPLASAGYGLTCAWAGRPAWHFHHMGIGEPIGYSARVSQNNSSLYFNGYYQTHVALMGDPTLRMHVIAPPVSATVLADAAAGGARISWGLSTNVVLGYHVYKASTLAGPFARITTEPVGTFQYVDPSPIGSNYYMVRAVNVERTTCGSYTNASQGVFALYNPPINQTVLPFAQAVLGIPYTKTFSASAGGGSYGWAVVDGSLPTGLALGVNGVLSGTPSEVGTFDFTAQITDSLDQTVYVPVSLTVLPDMIVTGDTLADGSVGVGYAQSLVATGGQTPFNWSFVSGPLPPGLTLSAGGNITGTPTTAGVYLVTAKVTDGIGRVAQRQFTLTINPAPPTIGTVSLAGVSAGSSYSEALSVTGGTPDYRWNLSAGLLPPGLRLSSNGLITGSPQLAGTYNFSVTATDDAGRTVMQSYSITVTPPPPAPEPGSFGFSANGYTVGGSATNVLITVVRSGGSDGSVDVDYGVRANGAVFAPASGTLQFAAGELQKSFSVLFSATRTTNFVMSLNLANPTGGASLGTPADAVVNVRTNDVSVPGTLQFASATFVVSETGTNAIIRVTRTGGSQGSVSVNYATVGGTAIPDVDYAVTAGTLTFADSETTKSFSVPVFNDSMVQGNASVQLVLTAPTGGASLGTVTNAVLNITDDEGNWIGRRQPDLMIKNPSDAVYAGSNIYNTTGASQARTQSGRKGQTRVFYVRIQNDARDVDSFVVRGAASVPGFGVEYFDSSIGGNKITAEVVAGNYRINNIPGGASAFIRVEVTLDSLAKPRTAKSWLVTATSVTSTTRKDAVKAIVQVAP